MAMLVTSPTDVSDQGVPVDIVLNVCFETRILVPKVPYITLPLAAMLVTEPFDASDQGVEVVIVLKVCV